MARTTPSQTFRSTRGPGDRADAETDPLRAKEIKRVRILSKSLAALLTASLLRTFIDGLDGQLVAGTAVSALLLAASLWLTAKLRNPDGS